MIEPTNDQLLTLVSQIVSAHIANNPTAPDAIPGLIRDIYQSLATAHSLTGLSLGGTPPVPRVAGATDHLECRECGMSMKMLKRHLLTVHGMTPAEYRTKWGMAADSPMVATNYARLRSALAKESGLGKRHTSPLTMKPRSLIAS